MATVSTIFALSSGPGKAGVAVIRVSGPGVTGVLERMAPPVPKPRAAVFRSILHPETGELLDRAVVLFFARPKSETGEDVGEFQVHGGRAVVAAVLDALCKIPGCRPAEPGEFARRAFANGKIDLAEVEGLADLMDAETEAQRRQALAQAGGALSRLYEGWRSRLIEIAALTEAAIDFSDEGDVGSKSLAAARERAQPLLAEMREHLNDGRRGEILRDGFRVALLGAPNAGKSSLLNALAQREAAIVSEEAGTTRDVIEVRLDLGGYPVIVSDTAGLREAEGRIEQEGIRRSLAAARTADLVLWLTEASDDAAQDPHRMSILETISRETPDASLWKVWTKVDLIPSPSSYGERARVRGSDFSGALRLSFVEPAARRDRDTVARQDSAPSPQPSPQGERELPSFEQAAAPLPATSAASRGGGDMHPSPLGEKVGEARMRGWAVDRSDIVHPLSPPVRPKPLRRGEGPRGEGVFAISSKTSDGIAGLVAMIARTAAERLGDHAAPALTQARHRSNLEVATDALDDFMSGDPAAAELRAEDMRRATHALGRITGRVDVEDILGQIFSRFCIGK